MKYLIEAREIYLEDEVVSGRHLIVENGLVKRLCSDLEACDDIIDLSDYTLMPGFIDTHIHGGNGFDTMDGTYTAINEISKFKIKEGVTSFCPTTITASLEDTKTAIINVKNAAVRGVEGAKIAGVFLEGPYISAKYKGAHDERLIRDVSLDEIDDLIMAGEGVVTSVIIAPEKENALDAIKYLKSKNIAAAVGHCDADIEDVKNGVLSGATVAVHTYNAMRTFTHRAPGTVGAVLTGDTLYAELVCDLIHVHPSAIEVLIRCKGYDKIILITDCMMAGGLKDGRYTLGGLDVIVKASVARTPDGVLAGSTLALNKAVYNMINAVNVSKHDAVNMATINPARAYGLDDKIGSIKEGKVADLIAVDDDFNVKFVMINGEVNCHAARR